MKLSTFLKFLGFGEPNEQLSLLKRASIAKINAMSCKLKMYAKRLETVDSLFSDFDYFLNELINIDNEIDDEWERLNHKNILP